MNAAIFLTFVAALTACRLALISDLLMVAIVLALLIVLVTTEPDSANATSPAPGASLFQPRLPLTNSRRCQEYSRRPGPSSGFGAPDCHIA